MSDTYNARPDLATQAKDVVRDVKAKASDLTDGVTRAAKDNASQLGDAARDMANTAKDKVESEVRERKSVGADYIGSIAQATHRAANEFETEIPRRPITSAKRPNKCKASPTQSASEMFVNSSARCSISRVASRRCSSAALLCWALQHCGS